MLSVFLAHAAGDGPFVHELRAFLELGCDGIRFAPDTAIEPGRDLLFTAETGLAAEILVLLLSPASSPPRWPLERWQPWLHGPVSGTDPHIAVFLLRECAFPQLLRRAAPFFDATSGKLPAMRQMKRWIGGVQAGANPTMTFSPDLEALYMDLDDRPGTSTASGEAANRFAVQAARDFAAVLWIRAHDRTLAQIAGELGAQLGMGLEGPLEENCARIRDVLHRRRCLVIFDAPRIPIDPLMASGRTSVLLTTERVRTLNDAPSLAAGRRLVAAGRFAEAYEVFYQLLNAGLETEACARELVWICERWDRLDEAHTLRLHYRLPPTEQMLLF